jgi:hypothetical protein
MQAVRRRDAIRSRAGRPRSGETPDRADQTHPTPHHYVVFRATTRADGTTARHYQVPGLTEALDELGFAAWLRDHIPGGQETDLVSVLVIEEELDRQASILACCLERRRGSATGPLKGAPARVSFTGAVDRVRLYRAAPRGALREMAPKLDRPPPRLDHLAGEEQAVRHAFGPAAHILDMRAPTVLEDIVGLTSVAHLRAHDGTEIDCGLGWHGTTPFVLRAKFPRFGTPPDLAASAAAAVALAAIAAGLTTYETRLDKHGPAVMARSNRTGVLYLIRPGADCVEAYTPGVPDGLLNADQVLWARYAQAHEDLTLIDAHRDGYSEDVFVFAGMPDGRVTRHLIDADGTEVWRAVADDTVAAAFHRARVTGPVRN